jgi:putative cell wall-binding protein
MFYKRNNKTKLLSVFVIILFVLNILSIQPALALNGGAGQKAYNFQGYRYIDTHNVEVWLDKSTPSVTASQVEIYKGSDINGQALQIQAVGAGSGSNITGVSGLSGGAGKMITTATSDAFVPGGLYTVVLNRTITANNGATLGSYGNKDVAFSFTVPDVAGIPNGSGTYSNSAQGSLNLSPQNNATNVPLENNIGFSVNIPVANYDVVKNGLVLKKDGVTQILDPTIDATQNGDIYSPLVTDDHTSFFFPMTGGGGAASYNLTPSSSYGLSIPAITLINGQTLAAQTVTFTTTANDSPSKVSPAPTAANSVDGSNLAISWTAPVGATGYNVYASEDPYWNFTQLNTTPINGLSYTTSRLKPKTAYYFRIASVNVTSETVFSDYVLATTPADTTAPVITLTGDASVNVANGAIYTDAGTTVTDNIDMGLTSNVTYTKDGNSVALIDTSVAGTYVVHYNASDAAGNVATEVSRTVVVLVVSAPIATTIVVSGPTSVTIPASSTTTNYSAIVKDQRGNAMNGETAIWSLQTPVTGVTIAPATGVVTIDNTASAVPFIVVAQNGSAFDNKTVTLTAPERIGGIDRYETAVKIAQDYFATGADTVVLARGDIAADALTAVPLAKHFNAPVLLTPQNQLPDQVLNEIKTLGAKTVYIVGGETAVSSKVADAITGQGVEIKRVAGIDRYATAYEVAKLLGNTGKAVIVNGNNKAYPDALSISSWAAFNGVPILYADGTHTLPEATAKALRELNVNRTILVGGTAVLPQSLEDLVPNPERYGGVDRYVTNSQVLSKLQPDSSQVFAATGNNFADALAGAAVAGKTNAWVILTGSSQVTGSGLTSEQQELLKSAQTRILDLHVFGGKFAVPDTTLNEMKTILNI